jgi:hypothetical protein
MATFLALPFLISLAAPLIIAVSAPKSCAAIAQERGRGLSIFDNKDNSLAPSAVLRIKNDVYFLTPETLWYVPHATDFLPPLSRLRARPIGPASGKVSHIPFHELCNMAYMEKRNSIAVLDKTGDVFEYSLSTKMWSLLLDSALSSGEPDYVELCAAADHICLLDPELNQLLRLPGKANYFVGTVPWRARKGEISLADGAALAFDNGTLVLHRNGRITVFGGRKGTDKLSWKPPQHMRPSRLYACPEGPLYVVDRENNRVLALIRAGKDVSWQQYLFGQESDLRGLIPGKNAFWILDRNRLILRSLQDVDEPDAKPSPRLLDERLAGLSIPIKSGALPRHPGVFPGARRLYRRGIHAGLDLFHDPGCGTSVKMDTPVLAADSGTIIRADWTYKDMAPGEYWARIQSCRNEHDCSEINENYFRGRQVEINHGRGLITRYAHLNGIKKGLKVGSKVSRGDVIGYVGVSGTSNTLPGRTKHPHLHFEVWMDGKYLGYGLTPTETIYLFEDIFGALCKRGGHEHRQTSK